MRRSIALIGLVLLVGCDSSPTNPGSVGSRWIWRENCPVAYPAQENSLYVLPYETGQSFVSRGNCVWHTRFSPSQFAYDFVAALNPERPMPIGTRVVAARAGDVILVEERFANATRLAERDNFVAVRHADATIALYRHLTTNGVLVAVGDRVDQGQVIGLSGDSGNSPGPQLHFEVVGCDGCDSIPITFRNTRPHPRGLIEGQAYRAQ